MNDYEIQEVPIAKVTLTKIKAELNNKNPNLVDRFVFVTSKGDITYKLKDVVTAYVGGIETSKIESVNITKIPDSIKDMAKNLNENGKIELEICYAILTKEIDGEKVEYRFIKDEHFTKWKII